MGELLRAMPARHQCEPPNPYGSGAGLGVGSVYRCGCGRRYVLRHVSASRPVWSRAHWPAFLSRKSAR